MVYDNEGTAVWSDPFSFERRQEDFPVQSELEAVLDTRRPRFSDVFRDIHTGEDAVLLAVPIVASGGELKGALAGISTLEALLSVGTYSGVLEITAGTEGFAYLVDGKGKVIYHQDISQLGTSLAATEPVIRATAGETGAVLTEDLTGEEIISGFAPLPDTDVSIDWAVITQERWRDVAGPIRDRSILFLGLLVSGGALTGVVIFLTIGRVLKPVRELTRGAQRVAGGDFDYTVEARTGDEIQDLAQQFNAMATALKESYAGLEQKVADRTSELRVSEERLRTVVAGAPILLFAVDGHEVMTFAEGQGIEALGIKGNEVVGMTLDHLATRMPQVVDDVRRALTGEAFATTVQFEGTIWEMRYSPHVGDNDEVAGVIGVCTDVAERVEAEEAERLRTQELEALFTVAPGDIENKVTRVLEQIAASAESEWVLLRLFDEEEQVLRLVSYVGPGLEEVPPESAVPPGHLMSGKAFEAGATMVVNDVRTYSDATPDWVAQGMMSGASLILKSGARLIGTVVLNSSRLDHFTPERVKFLTAIVDGIGVLLENARLLEGVRESEERYRNLFEESRDAIFVIAADCKVMAANQAALELFGFEMQDAVGSEIIDRIVDPGDLERFRRAIDQSGSVRDFEVKLRDADGSEIDCLMTATRRLDEQGRDLGVQGVIRGPDCPASHLPRIPHQRKKARGGHGGERGPGVPCRRSPPERS